MTYYSSSGKDLAGNEFGFDWPRFQSPKYHCAFFEPTDVATYEYNSAHIASRLSAFVFGYPDPRKCRYLVDEGCGMQLIGKNLPLYTWLPEYYVVEIHHAVSAPELNLFMAGDQLEGTLEQWACRDGKRKCSRETFDPCSVYENRSQCHELGIRPGSPGKVTRLPLKAILRAAGIPDLDVWNWVNGDGSTTNAGVPRQEDVANDRLSTIRNGGMDVVLLIEYRNDKRLFDSSHITFTIRPTALPNGQGILNQTIREPAYRNMTIIERAGIRLRVLQVGTVGVFDFQALLQTIVSSIALLAISSTVVQVIALNCCPLKALYSQYRKAVTPNLYEMKGLNDAIMARLETEDLINPRPAILFEAGQEHSQDGKSGVEVGVRSHRKVRVVDPENPVRSHLETTMGEQGRNPGGAAGREGGHRRSRLDSLGDPDFHHDVLERGKVRHYGGGAGEKYEDEDEEGDEHEDRDRSLTWDRRHPKQ